MIDSIYNYKKISPYLATGGQPNENQLHELSRLGYETVINLGLPGTEYSIHNEKEIIESYGMQYFHIPVNFENPEIEKYLEFANLFKSMSHKKVFIHCAANKRVSAFLAIFRVKEEGVPLEQAMAEVKSIWKLNKVWVTFMKKVIKNTDKSVSNVLLIGPDDNTANS